MAAICVCIATRAIPDLSVDEKLGCEAHHWEYRCRYRPQQAMMAHDMAINRHGLTNFSDPKSVQQWSSSISTVLNMHPQLVYKEVRKKGLRTLICDYKVGIKYWDVTGARTRA
jgi:hypothetical protein